MAAASGAGVPPEPAFHDFDPTVGEPTAAPVGPSLGVPTKNAAIDIDERGRVAQNAKLAAIGAPQIPPTAPEIPPAPAAAAPAGEGRPQAAAAASPNAAAAPAGPALLPYGSPAAMAPHPLGNTPAEKAHMADLKEQGERIVRGLDTAAQVNRDAVDAFKEQSDSLSTESQVARLSFEEERKRDTERRNTLAQETKDRQTKIDAKLADLQSQGVNPNHWWDQQSTGSKVLAAIAIGLGAFAAHPLGPHGTASENTALGIINGAISADIDSQKANLQKSLELVKMRSAENMQGFDHQLALLNAERDSTQTAYTIAQNDITKRASMYAQNAEMGQKAQALNIGLEKEKNDRIAALNEQIFALQKHGETIVGGTGADKRIQRIIDRTQHLRDNATTPMSVAEAQRQATAEEMGIDPNPGAGPMADYQTKAQKGAGGLSPRSARYVAQLNAVESAALELKKLLNKGSGLSLEDRARAATLSETIRQGADNKTLSEQPLAAFEFNSANNATLDTIIKDTRTKRNTIMSTVWGPADEGNPADLEEDK